MKEGKEKISHMGHFRSCTSMGEPYALVLVVTCRGMNSASLLRPPNAFCGIVNISQNCSRQLRNITRIYNKTAFFHFMPPQSKVLFEIHKMICRAYFFASHASKGLAQDCAG